MPPVGHYDVAIIGGGIVGSAAARELSPEYDVALLEKEHVAASASGTAAGFISDYWFFTDYAVLPGVSGRLADYFDDLDGTGHFEFHPEPYLRFQHDEALVEEIMAKAADLPREITFLDTDEIHERWPGAFDDLSEQVGAVVDEEAGYVDPHELTTTVMNEAERLGADVSTGTAVEQILTADGAVNGVRTEDGDALTADHVVCAAGAETPAIVDEFVDLPTRTLTYTNMRFRTPFDTRDVYPMGTIVHPADRPAHQEVYFRPDEGGDLMVAGGDFWVPSDYDEPQIIPGWWKEHAAEVLDAVLQGSDDMRYISGSEHGCPNGVNVTADGLPIIDRLADPEGLIVVDGVYAGISMVPGYAAAIRSLVTGEPCPFPLEPFRLDRPLEHDFDLEWTNDALLRGAAH